MIKQPHIRQVQPVGMFIYFAVVTLLLVGGFLLMAMMALSKAEKRTSQRNSFLIGLLALAVLLAPFRPLQDFFHTNISSPFLIIPGMLVLTALLILTVLRLGDSHSDEIARQASHRKITASLLLSALILGMTLYHLYWILIWDSTGDSLDLFFMLMPLAAAVNSGLILAFALPKRSKAVGIIYLAIVPALVIGTFALVQQVDFRELTARRAQDIGQAVQAYYAREGYYPQDLSQLVPRYFLRIPEPVFITGQDWCYEARDSGFQLAYVTRAHWSSPNLSARGYHPSGDIAGLERLCADQIAAQQQKQPWTAWNPEGQ